MNIFPMAVNYTTWLAVIPRKIVEIGTIKYCIGWWGGRGHRRHGRVQFVAIITWKGANISVLIKAVSGNVYKT